MTISHFFHPLRTFLGLLSLIVGLYTSAQTDNLLIYGTVKDYYTAQNVDSATVTIFKEGAIHSSFTTNASGKYEFELGYGYEYKLLFEKPGMVGKSVVINTSGVPLDEQKGGLAMNIEMALFKHIPRIDYSVLQQPIGKCKYDPVTNALAWDLEYTEHRRTDLNRLMKEYNEKK